MQIEIQGRKADKHNTYVGNDGLLYCSTCGEPREFRLNRFGHERVVGCICRCQAEENKELTKRFDEEALDRRREICFGNNKLKSATFKNDDRSNPKISDAMRRYADKFDEFKALGKGLLLYGSVGTGKTFYSACIANELIEQGYKVLMTNFTTIINTLQSRFDGRQEYIDGLNKYDLLILDDLGVERNSEYMLEQVYNIVNERYKTGKPMIITTNLAIEELKAPKEIEKLRVYDRILERCHPVEIKGGSKRRKNIIDTYSDMQEALGL